MIKDRGVPGPTRLDPEHLCPVDYRTELREAKARVDLPAYRAIDLLKFKTLDSKPVKRVSCAPHSNLNGLNASVCAGSDLLGIFQILYLENFVMPCDSL